MMNEATEKNFVLDERKRYLKTTGRQLLLSVLSFDGKEEEYEEGSEKLYLLSDGEYLLEGRFGTFCTSSVGLNDKDAHYNLDNLLYMQFYADDVNCNKYIHKVIHVSDEIVSILNKESAKMLKTEKPSQKEERGVVSIANSRALSIFDEVLIYIQHKDKEFILPDAVEIDSAIVYFKSFIEEDYFVIVRAGAIDTLEGEEESEVILLSTYDRSVPMCFNILVGHKVLSETPTKKNIDAFMEEFQKTISDELSYFSKVKSLIREGNEPHADAIVSELGYEELDYYLEKMEYVVSGAMKSRLLHL